MTLASPPTPLQALDLVLEGFDEIDELLTAIACLSADPLAEVDLSDELRGIRAVAKAVRRSLDALQLRAQTALPPQVPRYEAAHDFMPFVDEAKARGDLVPFADYLEGLAGRHGYPMALSIACRQFRGIAPPDENPQGGDDA